MTNHSSSSPFGTPYLQTGNWNLMPNQKTQPKFAVVKSFFRGCVVFFGPLPGDFNGEHRSWVEALTSAENNTELRSLEIRANDMESGSCMIQAGWLGSPRFWWKRRRWATTKNYGNIVCFLLKKTFSEKQMGDVTNWKCSFLFVCFFRLFGDVLTERDRLPVRVERSWIVLVFLEVDRKTHPKNRATCKMYLYIDRFPCQRKGAAALGKHKLLVCKFSMQISQCEDFEFPNIKITQKKQLYNLDGEVFV